MIKQDRNSAFPKYEFDMVDLSRQKFLKVNKNFVIFFPETFYWESDFVCERTDDEPPEIGADLRIWEKQRNYWCIHYDKNMIAAIGIKRVKKEIFMTWAEVNGVADSADFYFASYEDAKRLFDLLYHWKYDRTI